MVVFVDEGTYLTRGMRAEPYWGKVVSANIGKGRFGVKNLLSISKRVEYGHNIYKSKEDSPHLASHQSAMKKLVAVQATHKKESDVHKSNADSLKRKLLKSDKLAEANQKKLLETHAKLQDSEERGVELRLKLDEAVKVAKKQQDIVSSLFSGESGDVKNLALNQGGDRIVEKFRVILEEASNATTEKRLKNQVVSLSQEIKDLQSELYESSRQQSDLHKKKTSASKEKREAQSDRDAAKRSRERYLNLYNAAYERLQKANEQLKETKTKLESAAVKAEKWEQVPLLDRASIKGQPYRQCFVEHALTCLATGASAAVSLLALFHIFIVPFIFIPPPPCGHDE